MNCLAVKSQIAGTVNTHPISFSFILFGSVFNVVLKISCFFSSLRSSPLIKAMECLNTSNADISNF